MSVKDDVHTLMDKVARLEVDDSLDRVVRITTNNANRATRSILAKIVSLQRQAACGVRGHTLTYHGNRRQWSECGWHYVFECIRCGASYITADLNDKEQALVDAVCGKTEASTAWTGEAHVHKSATEAACG